MSKGGEMGGFGTSEAAVLGALAVYLVSSILYANDLFGGSYRPLDEGVEPFLIAASMRGRPDVGFHGRMGIVATVRNTTVMQEPIIQSRPKAETKAQAIGDGMSHLRRYGRDKVAEGRTPTEEVMTDTAEAGPGAKDGEGSA